MGKILSYKLLGTALKSLADAYFRTDEQQRNGEVITACGMSDDDLDRLCDIIPDMLNPMMSTEEVKEKLRVSDATLNRMVARGDLPHGECKKRGHTRYWKKWDILHYIKSKRKS
ncbi:MAG: Pyocin activator protein PrtN [Bacteriophage sp.]|nr:MAG: Pyocin activator protein PrtN [Bacteriophage sp.]